MPADLPPRIGRYRVVKLLGLCGPMYLGRDDESGRDVVIRAVHEAFKRDHFDRMAAVTARLDHPSVPRFLGFERDGEDVFAVMEHADGPTLTRALRSGLSVGRALRVVAEVLDGLSYAHAAGILHGDVRPSNILVPAQGPVKIFGFGSAASMSLASTRPEGSMGYLGPPGYMPPEVILGEPFSPRGDLFSVGCVLFEAVAGRPPFRAHSDDTLVEVLRRNLCEEPDYRLLPRGSGWKRLRGVVERAL
jgi:eukaryotic-like serine/threonine-protein kinase